ncbi:hypothetical protein MTY_0674 [Moorella thermoacetica Y72]|uniref:Uncharacterized protein n=1 Tax=Moorella thermoacetica Y72 TaxID=1325331 RepID=A0A0S6UCI6_NEOTH|nr:hypothetical protein MTY_0674 [Moorella thermoacetica Y72]
MITTDIISSNAPIKKEIVDAIRGPVDRANPAFITG